MSFNKDSLRVKIYEKSKPVESGCIEWTGWRSATGYGRIRFERRWQFVHRIVYEGAHGPLTKGLVVMHTCDNPCCINLAHLTAGTQSENIADMHSKHRRQYLSGALHPKAKLTNEQVAAARAAYHPSAEHTPFDTLDRWLSAVLAPLVYVGLGMALCAALMLIPQAL